MTTPPLDIPMLPIDALSPVDRLPIWLRAFDAPLIASTRLRSLRFALIAAATLLFASTWRLWTPQTLFPQVPLFAWGLRVPLGVDWALAGGMAISLFVALFARQGSFALGSAFAAFSGCLTAMILLDQHRAQPWAYQFVFVSALLAVVRPRRAFAWLRILTIAIYLHSAISKMDLSFCETAGPGFVQVLLRPLGLSVQSWPLAARRAAVLLFPIGELLVVVGLSFRRSRTLALVGAVLMHLTMLWVLGPWGLNHQPGVLIWNVYFIVQDCILFAPPSAIALAAEAESAASPRRRNPISSIAIGLVETLVAAAVLLPFLEPWGKFDHWPAWGLYATRGERTIVLVEESTLRKMPIRLYGVVEPTHPATAWWRLRLDQWSLEVLGAPLYPQNRFQIGVAAALAERYGLQDGIQVILESDADRWTGARSRESITGERQISEACDRYRLNAHPRSNLH